VHPAHEIVDRAAQLAKAFREHHLPVVLVNVTGAAPGRTDAGRPNLPRQGDWAELMPELQRQPGDHSITKQRWGAFIGTSLNDVLRERGVTQVVIAGISTSVGVESTARSAYDYGYDVVIVTDAVTDRDAENHRHSLEKVFPRMSETCTTSDVLNLLKER
jgi:nicotinamidase-related amidase